MLIAALLFHAVLQRRETCPAVRCGPAPASPPHAAARRAEWHQECAAACSLVRARGAALKATEQPIDTSTAAGKCFLDMLDLFAEFETNLRRERQLEGIRRPGARDEGAGARAPPQIAKVLKIGRASVYRVLEAG
jgi:hypothetical protein